MTEYVLGLYEKSMPDTLSLREKLSAARESGYDFLELSVDETEKKLARLDWTRAERMDVIRSMTEAALPIGSICLSGHRKYPLGHPNPLIRSRSLQIMEQAICLAGDLGIRLIQIAGYDVYYERSTDQTQDWFEENLHRSVDMASRAGVVIAFETMETDFMNTVGKAIVWIKKLSTPWLQIYPDAGNITNAAKAAGINVTDDLRKGQGHLAAVHLKEAKPGIFREVPYGTGHVDFAAITRTAWELGVRRYLAEFWYDGAPDWMDTLKRNNYFLKSFLDMQG